MYKTDPPKSDGAWRVVVLESCSVSWGLGYQDSDLLRRCFFYALGTPLGVLETRTVICCSGVTSFMISAPQAWPRSYGFLVTLGHVRLKMRMISTHRDRSIPTSVLSKATFECHGILSRTSSACTSVTAMKTFAPAPVLKKIKTMEKRKQCKAYKNRKRCQAYTASPRSEYCRACFLRRAAFSGSQSGGGCSGNKGNVAAKGNRANKGNSKGNPDNNGNVKGNPDNQGNEKGNPGNEGKVTGNPGNEGNAKGNPGNEGNVTKGKVKGKAGRRSALKRSADYALVVKKCWLDKILSGKKDWEIRGRSCARRGYIHLAESAKGGVLVGQAELVDCIKLTKAQFSRNKHHHGVSKISEVPYKRIYAWVLTKAKRFARPLSYDHTLGAITWVKVTA